MSRHAVIVLAAIIVGLIGLFYFDQVSRKSDEPPEAILLLPGLKQSLDALEEITITKAGNERVATIRRQGERWVVSERGGYPADVGKLRSVLLALADATRIEEKTSKPELYERLGVEPVDAEDAGGVAVGLRGGTVDAAVILGERAQGDFRYVRLADESTSWLVDQYPDAGTAVSDWLVTDILDIDSARVLRAKIEHPDGETVVVVKEDPDASAFVVKDVPEGRELQYASIGNGIGGALDGLRLEDVRQAREVTEGATPIVTTHETKNGLVVTTRAIEDGEETWLSFEANVTEAASDEPTTQPAAEAAGSEAGDNGESGESEDVADTQDTAAEQEPDEIESAEAQAAAINARVSGWEYRLPAYKSDNLTRRWDDLLKSADD